MAKNIKKRSSKKNQTLDVFSNKLAWSFYLLLFIGLLQVYSSSAIYASENFGSSLFFFKKQVVFAGLAAFWFFLSFKIPYRLYTFLGGLLFLGSFAALCLTHVSGLGVTIGGATRWLNLPGGFRLEPSEFYKVSFGFFIYFLMLLKEKRPEISVIWPFLSAFLVSLALFLKQPDFGSVILLTLATLVALFLWVRDWRPFVALGVLALGGLVYFLTAASYRVERVMIFLDPWKDPQGKGFQTIQSFVAFKKGGFFGEGLGKSQAKFFFLPEAHTDFTLAVFAEEMGFVGLFFLLSVYIFLTFQLLKIARQSDYDFKIFILNYYLATLFFFYFFINVCVNIGLLPTKGLPLPFMSYGGSSLVATAFLMGFFASQYRPIDKI